MFRFTFSHGIDQFRSVNNYFEMLKINLNFDREKKLFWNFKKVGEIFFCTV